VYVLRFFSKLYDNTHEDLKKYVLKLVNGDRYLAEEIIQDTYLQAKENQDELLEHPNPAGWLFVTAKNLYYKQMKSIADYSVYETELTDDLADLEIDFLSFGEDKYEERLQYIKSNLNEKETRLFTDYYIKKLSLKEISKNINENYTNIRKANSRLKIKLINLIKKFF